MSDASTSAGRPDGHTIVIRDNAHRVRVIHGGVTMADTQAALTLSETGLADVFYFPREHVNMARLERSAHTSHCPFKGDASYFHLRTEDGFRAAAEADRALPLRLLDQDEPDEHQADDSQENH